MEDCLVTKSYKETLISIYKDLDELQIEEVQEGINKIKDEISELISKCDESESEKEKILINDFIKDDTNYNPIQPRTKELKGEILEQGKDEEFPKASLKDLGVLGILILALIGAVICLFLI